MIDSESSRNFLFDRRDAVTACRRFIQLAGWLIASSIGRQPIQLNLQLNQL